MATLVALLVLLACSLHAVCGIKNATAIVLNTQLDIVGTDAVKDIIRFYNTHYRHGLPTRLPDIIRKKDKAGGSWYNLHATEGIMMSKGITLGEKLIDFKSTQSVEHDIIINQLTATIPITVRDLVLLYDNVEIDIHIVDRTTSAPFKSLRGLNTKPKGTKTGAAEIVIGRNEFLVPLEVVHLDSGNDTLCVATIHEVKAEEFEVADIKLLGITDPVLLAIIDALSNKFKASILKDTYAPQIIKSMIETIAPTFFDYCYYVKDLSIRNSPRWLKLLSSARH